MKCPLNYSFIRKSPRHVFFRFITKVPVSERPKREFVISLGNVTENVYLECKLVNLAWCEEQFDFVCPLCSLIGFCMLFIIDNTER